MTDWGAELAAVCATLNAAAALLLTSGLIAIRRGARRVHGRLMASAFVVSAVFLAVYLTRAAIGGTRHYAGVGPWRTVYFAILMTHMLLAAAVPPLAIYTIYLALKKRFAAHRKIVKVTLPVWLYVSVTGVAVYVLLYHPPS